MVQSFLTIINQNKYPCQFNAFEIDKKKIQDFFINTSSILMWKNSRSEKQLSYGEKNNWKCRKRKYSGHLVKFLTSSSGVRSSRLQCKLHVYKTIFNHALKPDKQKIFILLNILWASKVFINIKWFQKISCTDILDFR